MASPVRRGDRFRTTRDATFTATFLQFAPAHTVGAQVRVPPGTVLVAVHDQAEGAGAVSAYPEAYDELESTIVPPTERASPSYAGAYAVFLPVDDIGDLLQPLDPLRPRPSEQRLPRVSRFGEW
jgi:hypothetical protein